MFLAVFFSTKHHIGARGALYSEYTVSTKNVPNVWSGQFLCDFNVIRELYRMLDIVLCVSGNLTLIRSLRLLKALLNLF